MFDIDYVRALCSLEGQHAVVTGGSQGIGRAIACSLASFGARVTILGRNPSTLDETLALLDGEGHERVVCDVSDLAAVDAFFSDYQRRHPALDIFVNNAAYSVHATLEEADRADIDGMVDTNLKGAIACLQHAGKIMKRQQRGSIVVLSSVNGLNSHPTQAIYSVTKFALEGVVKALASSLGPYNVRVNSCAPGAIDTPINAEAFSREGFKEEFCKKVSLKRIGSAKEIGDAVCMLAGGAFAYMTGATVVIDGGLMLKQV
ncbi:MAG: SDR family oxidoreductase [Spirochaetales bacterium]|nr:SDR family oxidoreductase [Spirochaetales bacterium]HQB90751.1 SDR family NAD(P)-dependent oxidoreductase [Sphaerochaeta sp.]